MFCLLTILQTFLTHFNFSKFEIVEKINRKKIFHVPFPIQGGKSGIDQGLTRGDSDYFQGKVRTSLALCLDNIQDFLLGIIAMNCIDFSCFCGVIDG